MVGSTNISSVSIRVRRTFFRPHTYLRRMETEPLIRQDSLGRPSRCFFPAAFFVFTQSSTAGASELSSLLDLHFCGDEGYMFVVFIKPHHSSFFKFFTLSHSEPSNRLPFTALNAPYLCPALSIFQAAGIYSRIAQQRYIR